MVLPHSLRYLNIQAASCIYNMIGALALLEILYSFSERSQPLYSELEGFY